MENRQRSGLRFLFGPEEYEIEFEEEDEDDR